MKKINLLGVDITTASKKEILEYLAKEIKSPHAKIKIFTPNPEIITYATKHEDFKKGLNQGQILIPDGIGVAIGAQIVANSRLKRIPGIELMEDIVKAASDGQISVSKRPVVIGFLGGLGTVAEETAECLKKKYPKINIGYAAESWDKEKMIYSDIDILFVAFGSPKQEEWINENLDKIPVKIAMGVGGSFDYLSGHVPRAPKFVRNIGFEWMFRLAVQPWRWKRQLRLFDFSALILRQALGNHLNFFKK